LKYDRQTGTRTSIELGKGRVSGEAVFAPAAGGTAEDDGYLMTFIYDAPSDTSEYVIFDAKTMSADPIATVQLPRVPFGFHGSWVPSNIVN
jgi:carotenoid cleavage dioxygenase